MIRLDRESLGGTVVVLMLHSHRLLRKSQNVPFLLAPFLIRLVSLRLDMDELC